MTRTEIRYALFRCKVGSPDKVHTDIFNIYKPELDELGLDISDFTKEWDISKQDPLEIVTGKIARKYNQEQSLFTSSGSLKD